MAQPVSVIPRQTMKRLPYYYNYLKALQEQGIKTVSAAAIGNELHLNHVQVRKDLASVSKTGGKPRTGFDMKELLGSIEECLGYHRSENVVLIGAGNLGRALISYEGLEQSGYGIVAAFDNNPDLLHTQLGDTIVLPIENLKNICQRFDVKIGIITVPAEHAQVTCDRLVEAGVVAIWNFAPIRLQAPGHVRIQNENMAASLSLLSQHLTETNAGAKQT